MQEANAYLKKELGEDQFEKYEKERKEDKDNQSKNIENEGKSSKVINSVVNGECREDKEVRQEGEQEREEEQEDEEVVQWVDTEKDIESEDTDIFLSPAVISFERTGQKTLIKTNERKEEEEKKNTERIEKKSKKEDQEQSYLELNNCKKCKKKVGQKAIAIQCWNCNGWYHSHSKCGLELERIHNWISQREKEEKKEEEEEEENEEETLEWICRKCRESKREEKPDQNIKVKLESEIDRLKQELKTMAKKVEAEGKYKEELEAGMKYKLLEKQSRKQNKS